MRQPWSVPVLLALAAFVGYAAASRPVQAQTEQWPFSRGEVLTLPLPGDGTHRCTVEEIKGTFARCGTAERESFSVGSRERPQECDPVPFKPGAVSISKRLSCLAQPLHDRRDGAHVNIRAQRDMRSENDPRCSEG